MKPNLKTWFRVDHHVHTSTHSPDSVLDPEALIEDARRAGLSAVVITEHDYQWEADELEELNRRSEGLLILSGAEISTQEGHVLVYGLPDLDEVEAGLTLAELLPIVNRHQAAIVGAHPFRWEQEFQEIIAGHGPVFDALELVSNNVSPETRRRTADLLARYPGMGATGSSDAHRPEVVGCYHTCFPKPIRSMADFVKALKQRTGQPGYLEGSRLVCGTVELSVSPARAGSLKGGSAASSS